MQNTFNTLRRSEPNVIRVFAIALAVSVVACGSVPDPVSVPAGWKRTDVGPFSFWAPPDLRDLPLAGVPTDSYVREFQGKDLVIFFDYGFYSSALQAPAPTFRSHNELIGGRAARMVSYTATPKNEFRYPDFVAVNFAQTGKRGMRLTLYASCAGMSGCRDAEDVFRSIRFK
jgi:hypothetical protein